MKLVPSEKQACEARDFVAHLPCLLRPFTGLSLYIHVKRNHRESIWHVLVPLVLSETEVQGDLSLTFLVASLLTRRPVIDFPSST